MRTFLFVGALLWACAPAVQPPSVSRSTTATPSVEEQVVQAQVEAYNRRDLEGFLATYAPDARLYTHPDQLRRSGVDQMRQAYGRLFASSPQLHARITQRIVQGNYVIDHEHVTGLPNGAENSAVAIYEVRNGKIQNVWFIR